MAFPPRLLALTLRVRDLEAALSFYQGLLGLRLEADPPRYRLYPRGQGFHLELVHAPEAPLRPYPSVGLYHFALLLPDRRALAGVAQRLLQAGAYFEEAADHGVSEALYFRDPEGNGLELYWDRPQGAWPSEPLMFTAPLNLEGLLSQAPKPSSLPPETLLGHLHLHVEDLKEAEALFANHLGMEVTLRTYPGALFFAWDGYHHYVGANVWAGKRRAPPESTGLLGYTLLDPWGRTMELQDPTGAQMRLTASL
ncbi:glyoxalase [Thermus scotoductus]|uniref:Glyoxalase n=1 Tax=Thermus scotoductus TaxID=37636 RepID=A0A430QVD7_THESC|nr:VOC family protein [Thermus scotoductus]RTG98937.1 glyoxalase [Thermus scotoductus]